MSYTTKRAELVAQSEALSGPAKYAIWDLIAAMDAMQPEGDPLDAARRSLADWPDPDQRYTGSTPAVPSEAKPRWNNREGLNSPAPISVFSKRNNERAQASVAAKRGSTTCPKNGGKGHVFRPYTNGRERCAKCSTARNVYPKGTKPKPSAMKDEWICPKTKVDHRWKDAPSGLRECKDCRTRRKVAA